MPKQNRSKVHIGEYEFDSKLEAKRYVYLLSKVQDGTITGLEPRPLAIILQEGCTLPKNALRPKKLYRANKWYTPDFSYIFQGVEVFEDVKAAYSKSGKGRARKGKPIVSEASSLRMGILQRQRPYCVVVMVTVVTWWWGDDGGHKLL